MFATETEAADGSIGSLAGGIEVGCAGGDRGVIPLVAVILEVGVYSPQVEAGEGAQFVVGRTGETPAVAVIAVFADGVAVVNRMGESGSRIDGRLEVIDAASIEIVGTAKENA